MPRNMSVAGESEAASISEAIPIARHRIATCHVVRLFTSRDASCISESTRRDDDSFVVMRNCWIKLFALLFMVVCGNVATERVYIFGHAFWKTLRNAAGFRR